MHKGKIWQFNYILALYRHCLVLSLVTTILNLALAYNTATFSFVPIDVYVVLSFLSVYTYCYLSSVCLCVL